MKLLFTFLESNATMYKVLGMTLAIGNIINGGTPKGRADGFELAVFSKLSTTKDNSQRTLLQFIMKKLVDEDQEMSTSFKLENKVWSTRSTDLDPVIKKYNDTNANFLQAEAAHKSITESGEARDDFMNYTSLKIRNIKT